MSGQNRVTSEEIEDAAPLTGTIETGDESMTIAYEEELCSNNTSSPGQSSSTSPGQSSSTSPSGSNNNPFPGQSNSAVPGSSSNSSPRGSKNNSPGPSNMTSRSTERIIDIDENSGPMSKLKKACSSVTLEPLLFLKMIAESNFKVVADTLEIERICSVNLGYNATDCAHMDDGNHSDIQNEVQRYQNNFNYQQSLMDSILPLLVVLFAGSLSDRFGRKPPMIAVLIGFIILGSVYILVAVEGTWPVQVLLAGTLAVDITGSWVVYNMAVYSYVADITTSDHRTKRMGVIDFFWYIGSPLGTLMGGWLYKFGYVAVFATSTALWGVCLLYTIFFVKESHHVYVVPEEQRCEKCGPLKHVGDLFRTGFKKRPGEGRFHLIVLLGLKLAVFLVQGHQVYKWSRVMLHWGPTQYSTWATADSLIHQCGMVTWVWFAERRRLHDCSKLLGGLISIMLWSVVLACITGPDLWWLVIIASFLGMFEGSMEPSIRSMVTSVVGNSEAGKVLALMGLLEAAWFTVDSGIYTALYNAFIGTFTQINFVVQASIALLLIPVVIALRRHMIKHPSAASKTQ